MKNLFKKKAFKIGVPIALAVILGLVLFFTLNQQNGYDENAIFGSRVSDLNRANQSVSGDTRFSGVVESQQSVQYKKNGERKIEEIYVKVGDTIKKGASLFRYDVKESENSIAQAQLDIEGKQQEINILAADPSTEAQIAIRQADIEIRKLKNDIASYQQEIDNAIVKSDIDGIVKAVNETGVSAQGMDAPIVEVMEIGEYRVKGKVDEQQIYALTVGDEMKVISRVDESKSWIGVLQKIETEPENNEENSLGNDTSARASSYPFYVALEDTEGLMLGQHVFVEVSNGMDMDLDLSGIWLDLGYVVHEEDGTYAWVSENGKLKKRPVEVGETNEEMYIEEIVSGLEDSDIIVWPDETYTEGMQVIDASEASE